MAMLICPDCGKKVSTQAECCPNCGRVVKAVRNRNAFNPFHDPVHFIALLIAVGVVAFLVICIIAIVIALCK